MSENIQSISQGTYTLGETNKLTFSAGPGIKIDEPSAGTVRIGTDETVLWSGDASPSGTITGTYSEPISNFERVRMYWRNNDAGSFKCAEFYNTSGLYYIGDVCPNGQWWKGIKVQTNTTGFTNVAGWEIALGNPTTGREVNYYHFFKLVGINRLSGSNA